MNRLVLFTHMFPYGNHETFLETEIQYLAAEFKTVTVVPAWKDGTNREVPKNVHIDTTSSRKEIGKFPRFLSAMLRVNPGRLIKELFTHPGLTFVSPKAIWRSLIYLDDATRIMNWLEKDVGRDEVSYQDAVFYSYWLRGQALGIALFKQKSKLPLYFISRAHGGDIYLERHDPPYLPFREDILSVVDHIFPVSNHGSQYLQQRYPGTREKTTVSKLGVSDPGFMTGPGDDGVVRIVSCSSLLPVKRLDLLIAGLQAYTSNNPAGDVEWHHLGSGPMLEELKDLASRALGENVSWTFHGQLANQDVLDFYHQNPIDAFINVSSSEGIPVSIMEAQSCGLPVIAAAVGGIPEIVSDENGVLLAKDPTPEEIAGALQSVLAYSPQRRRRIRTIWSENYNAEDNYRSFIALIEDHQPERVEKDPVVDRNS